MIGALLLAATVSCASDPSQTYEVRLPPGYTAEKRWPIVYVFDPRRRGAYAADLFADAAAEFGWIVVSSNDTRSDEDSDANARAIRAMWPDAQQRWSVDPRRIYTAGFSGGAILAWQVAKSTKKVAGVIGCSGRLDDARDADDATFAWFGTAGDEDFNYLETRMIDARLRGPHEFVSFAGAHQWPPKELLREALAWMEAPKTSAQTYDDENELAFERAQRKKMTDAINRWLRSEQPASTLRRGLEIAKLQKDQRKAAKRVLNLIRVQLGFYLPAELRARGAAAKASELEAFARAIQ
ncbi:MAG TPA: hypothetical protein VJ276_02555 [Thermoanaerobaculia bacterium]|nr:hypothetical protein [Thermoanaerobaculia bacterium]